MKKLIENLKEIGFNTYEAKVYIALLKNYPSTGYEISKIADIPQSRAYDTLSSLEKEQIVTADNSRPIKYSPVNPKDLIKRCKRKVNSTFDFLDKNLPHVKDDYIEPVFRVAGIENIKEKIIDVINDAQEELYIEIWSKEYNYFESYLYEAYTRGVEIKIVGYDNLKSNFAMVFEHDGSKEIEKFIAGKFMIIASDNQEGIVGYLSYKNRDNMNIICTKNEGIVMLLKEFIVHDMYLTDVEKNFSQQFETFYGRNLKSLRDKIFGKDKRRKIH